MRPASPLVLPLKGGPTIHLTAILDRRASQKSSRRATRRPCYGADGFVDPSGEDATRHHDSNHD